MWSGWGYPPRSSYVVFTCGLKRRMSSTSGAAASSIGTSAKHPSGSGGSGSPSGRPESTNRRNSCSTPSIPHARSISTTRLCGSPSHTSGRSMAGFSTEPRSPPVHVATSTRAPSATYLAMVAAPLLDSSSGWAWTASRRNWSGEVTRALSPVRTTNRWGPPATLGKAPVQIVRKGEEWCWSRQGTVRFRISRTTSGRAPGFSTVLAWPGCPRGRPLVRGAASRVSGDDHVSTPTDEQDQGVWLTQEAHDRLKAELDQLVANRPAMSAEINARREEGDLKENGGYHAAKEEQGKQEGRIRQLQELLRTAQVGDAPTTSGVAGPGMVVTVRFAGDDETEKFLLGSREIAGTTDLAVYSPESALGSAIMGAKPGATVTYQTPNGRDITVDVVGIEPFIP